MCSSAGYRIGPGEIENCLLGHPAVANAAVVPKPDAERGALVKAYVVLTPEYQGRDPDSITQVLQEHVRDRLAPYEYPKEIEYVDALPMTTTGKSSAPYRAAARPNAPAALTLKTFAMPIYQLDDLIPAIDPSAYLADSADIIGNVTLEAGVSIWSQVSIRGDNAPILVRSGTNIQEASVLHVDAGCPMTVGPNVTIGHQAMLHGCTIHEGALVGMQAIVLNNAVIGRNCLIGAGAIIPEGRIIPDNSLVIGIGKIVRELSAEEIAEMQANNRHYVERGQHYKTALKRIG